MIFRKAKKPVLSTERQGWTLELRQGLVVGVRSSLGGPPSKAFEFRLAGYRETATNGERSRKAYGTLHSEYDPDFSVAISISFELTTELELTRAQRLDGWIPARTDPTPGAYRRPEDPVGLFALDEIDSLPGNAPGSVPVCRCTLVLTTAEWKAIEQSLQIAASSHGFGVTAGVRVEFPTEFSDEQVKAWDRDLPHWGITHYWFKAGLAFDRPHLMKHPEFLSDAGN